MKPNLFLITQAAINFSNILRRWLTPEQMAQVIERNMARHPGVCHSHDFCDANMAMDEAWNNLGFIHYQLGELNEAILAFEKGLTFAQNADLEAIRIYNNLAATHLKKNEPQKAEDILNKALKLNPKIPHSYQNLCHLYYQQGNIAKVIETLEKAIQHQAGQLLGEQLDFHLNLANMHAQQSHEDKALAVLEKAKALFTEKEERARIQQKIDQVKKGHHAPKTTYAG